MGCTNAKESKPASTKESEMFANDGRKGDGSSARAVTTATSGKSDAGMDRAGEDFEKKSDAMHVDRVEIGDLVEKEKFEDVYTVGDVLGKGNYSVVKKCFRKDDPKKTPYAVKIIKDSSLTPEDREALKIETSILKQIDSPHIIKLFGFFEDPAKREYYIVTEFVGGGELFDRIIEKEYYSEKDAQKLVLTIAKALQYCHSRGVVHRDLKPENILLTSKNDDDSVKIADFGFAKQIDTSSDEALSTSCGTPGYVSPEILNGQKYGPEVDMWSLGVIVYILLCGYPPFFHDNQKELFKQIRGGKYTFDEEYWGEVSEEAKDLIRNLLQVDRTKRLRINQLLEHPWLVTEAKNTNLTDIQPKLRAIMAKRKFKASVHVVMAKARMEKILTKVTEASQNQDAVNSNGSMMNGNDKSAGDGKASPNAVSTSNSDAKSPIASATSAPAPPSATVSKQ